MRFKIALRNITRHRLRSFLTIGMIASAVCSIIMFHGLSDYFMSSLREVASETQFGHIQIATESYWTPGSEGRKERMFNMSVLEKTLKAHPEIIQSSGRLSFYTLISNGDLSISGRAIGFSTTREPRMRTSLKMLQGRFFNDGAKEVIVGGILATQMGVKPGDNITVLTNTVDGVMNALDMTVSGIFTGGLDEIDSQFIYMGLEEAQGILDTKDVDLAILKMSELPLAEKNLNQINRSLKDTYKHADSRQNLRGRTWEDLAVLYRQCVVFYRVQNRLIEGILLALMFLGILNAVSMTVVERTGEIGTLRSFGESRQDIILQFLLESFVIVLTGILLGTFLAGGLIILLDYVRIVTEIPGATIPIMIKVHFLITSVIYAAFLALVTTVIATLIPAQNAAKMNIVDALRKNI